MAKIGPFTITVLRDADLALKQVSSGVRKLTFDDNFESKTVTVTLTAGGTAKVVNPFPVGVVPSEWFVVDRIGAGGVMRGPDPWGTELSFEETSGTDAVTATVRLFR